MINIFEEIGWAIEDVALAVQDVVIGNTVHKGSSTECKSAQVLKNIPKDSWSEDGDRRISLDPYDNWVDPGIETLSKTNEYKNTCLLMRANNGWQVVKHVFAVYLGKERLYSDTWCSRDKLAANAVCEYLQVPKLYTRYLVGDEHLEFKDYHADKYHTARPILTYRMILEAANRFGFTVLDDTDSDVDVIDIEERVVKKKKKAESKKLQENKVNPKQTVASDAQIEPTVIYMGTSKASEQTVKDDDVIETIENPVVVDAVKIKPEEKKEEPKVESAVEAPKVEESKKPEKKEVIRPITFDNPKMDLFQNESVQATNSQVRIFFESFKEVIPRVGMQNIALFATREGSLYVNYSVNNMWRCQYIDPNVFVSNGYNVIGWAKSPDGKEFLIPVNCKETDICVKIFGDPNAHYVMSPDELQKCQSYLFKNTDIYLYIDMTGMSDNIRRMSQDEFDKLGKKLTFIIQSFTDKENNRYRFGNFKNIDTFYLISNEKVRAPFKDESMPKGMTELKPNGIKITVNGDDVTYDYPSGETATLTIENYNLM